MARLRTRHIILCAITIIFLYHTLPRDGVRPAPFSTSSHRVSRAGTIALAKYMNNPNYIPKIVATESSFAWNRVNFQYPPPRTPKLPPPFTKRPRIQYQFRPDTPGVAALQEERRIEVKRVFKKSWASYKSKAWMKDALKPLSGEYVNQFSGWAATLVDSLDTLWIMGLRDEFWDAVGAVATIDFGKSTAQTVNMFETCIRYLGGLIAAYDLSGSQALKAKAVEVGDLLYAGFNTENNMPVDFIGFQAAKEGLGLPVEDKVASAGPGTLSLEFSRLSQITGDSKYYSVISNLMDTFYENQNKTELPGMWPMMVSMRDKDVVTGSTFTVKGNADSLYEYLPKTYATPGHKVDSPQFQDKTFPRNGLTLHCYL